MAKTPALIGPFPASVAPARNGTYKRDTIRSGKTAYAVYKDGEWFKYSTDRRNAERKARAGKVSDQELDWYGISKATRRSLSR